MQHPSLAALMITGLVSTSIGCASTDAGSRSSNDSVAQPGRTTLTIENILQWPLEGPAGVDRIIDVLRRDGRMSLQGRSLNSIDTYRFGDGYEAEFIHIDIPSSQINIGIGNEKCLDPGYAAELSGSDPSPVREDSHGVDHGRNYIRRKADVLVHLSSTPITDVCIESIYISTKKDSKP